MRPPLNFFVHGIPRPAGSKKAFPIFRGKGANKQFMRSIVTDACAKTKPWQHAITSDAAAALRASTNHEPFSGPVSLDLVFHLARIKGHFRTGKRASELRPDAPTWHTVKPDLLKLTRAVEDALTSAGVWHDDAQIARETLAKCYAAMPGVGITIKEVE